MSACSAELARRLAVPVRDNAQIGEASRSLLKIAFQLQAALAPQCWRLGPPKILTSKAILGSMTQSSGSHAAEESIVQSKPPKQRNIVNLLFL